MRARLTPVLIVLALLAQALAMVRHNTMVVSSAITAVTVAEFEGVPADLARDLAASICHPGDVGSSLPGDQPAQPRDLQTKCPLCNGLAAATLLPLPEAEAMDVPVGAQAIAFPPFDERLVTHRLIRPKSRGPPAVSSLPT